MAIVKHIKSRNANYSAAINYLLFEHDEKTRKKILDESGRSILRKEFYMDGLNCDPMSFDKECELTNAHFHKNKKREDIKSHHYIISYDPADVTENGLTGEKAQAISLELAKQMFPRYQSLVVTHTDDHNESGNIHTHIVINSVRKDAVIDFFGFVASIFWYPYFSVFFSAILNISLGCTEHQHDQFPCLHLVNHLCKRKR